MDEKQRIHAHGASVKVHYLAGSCAQTTSREGEIPSCTSTRIQHTYNVGTEYGCCSFLSRGCATSNRPCITWQERANGEQAGRCALTALLKRGERAVEKRSGGDERVDVGGTDSLSAGEFFLRPSRFAITAREICSTRGGRVMHWFRHETTARDICRAPGWGRPAWAALGGG